MAMLFYSREDRDRVGYRVASGALEKQGIGGNGGGGSSGEGKARREQVEARTKSFQALVKYAEQTDRCRHVVIGEFFGEEGVAGCDRACDVCFVANGGKGLKRRKEEGLSSEEWVSTQRARDDFYGDEYE